MTLSARAISLSYGAVQALEDVTLDLTPGEVVALVGDNGAGKSTLVKVLSGVVTPDAGTLEQDGQPVRITSPKDAQRLGIATVHQDLALCENLDVVSNLFLGAERQRWSLLRPIRMERTARDLLASLNVRIPDIRVPVAMLSGGQRQSVAIARSLITDPRVVILDEPTAALGYEQTKNVEALIRRMADQGIAIVIVTHDLPLCYEVADRMVILNRGRKVADVPATDCDRDHIVGWITGSKESMFPLTSQESA